MSGRPRPAAPETDLSVGGCYGAPVPPSDAPVSHPITRRSLLWGSLAGGASILAGTAPAQALTYTVKSEAEHAALPIRWGYPFWSRGSVGSGVDGYPGQTYSGHIGTDFYASPRVGTAVLSVADGTVSAIGDDGNGGRGVFVVVEHAAGVRSEYLHLDRRSVSVSRRQRVTRGTPLALTGNTGDVRPRTVGNAHLHLAIFSGAHRTGTVWNARWLVERAELMTPPPQQRTTVFRFWSDVYRGHFFTADVAERDHIVRQLAHLWRYEGEAFVAFSAPTVGTVPVHRFYSSRFAGHFYTPDSAERDVLITSDPNWAYEGVAFHAYPASARIEGTRSVARFWSSSFGHHFYTADTAERDSLIRREADVWAYEGEGFRVAAS